MKCTIPIFLILLFNSCNRLNRVEEIVIGNYELCNTRNKSILILTDEKKLFLTDSLNNISLGTWSADSYGDFELIDIVINNQETTGKIYGQNSDSIELFLTEFFPIKSNDDLVFKRIK